VNNFIAKIFAACLLLTIISYWFIPSSYEIRNEKPRGLNIVCFGDSLTAGVGAADGMDYPAQLSRLIGEEVVNAGVPGDTTSEALARIGQVIELQPRIVLITLGGNDLKNGVSKTAAFKNLAEIVRRFQAIGALVVIGGIEVPFWGRGFGDAYKELARKTGSLQVPNVFEGIIANSALMSDQIHPNGQGYGIMSRHFYKVIKPYI